MNRLATIALILLGISGKPATAQPASPSQAIEIPGDPDVPFEQQPAMILANRDFRAAIGDDRRNARAIALLNAGRLTEAEALLKALVAEELTAPDRDYNHLAGWEMNLALVLRAQGRAEETETLFRRALERIDNRSDSEQTVYKISTNLGSLLSSQGRFAEAEPLLRRAAKGAGTGRGKGSDISLYAQINLGYALLGTHKVIELVTLLQSVDTQIKRYNYAGSDVEARLTRLQCLARGACQVSDGDLRAEASRAMNLNLLGGIQPIG